MTQEQKRHIRQLRAAGEGYKRISTLLDIPVGTIKSFCRRDEADEPAVTDYRAPQKLEITIKNSVFQKPLRIQGVSPAPCSVFMYFPLFLPLRAETRESSLCPADYLVQQPCGSTLRFPCSVSVDGHCGIDIGVP